ncbi:hypothetical protein LMG22931_05626 [Paraburkholderia nemoris]|nr:hypothetical protein LMG22931_05626 [Paraburkholderia nemoris]
MNSRLVAVTAASWLLGITCLTYAHADESADDFDPPSVDSQGYAMPRHAYSAKDKADEPLLERGSNASERHPAPEPIRNPKGPVKSSGSAGPTASRR